MKSFALPLLLSLAACGGAQTTPQGAGFERSAAPVVNAATPSPSNVTRALGNVPIFTSNATVSNTSPRFLARAYSNANRANIAGRFSGAPIAVADITGVVFRVTGPQGDIGFVKNVQEPFLAGSAVPERDLMQAVSEEVARRTGCAWTGQTAVTRSGQARTRSFGVGLSC